MGKIVQDNFSDNLKNAINDYSDIKKDYESRFNESINLEPYDSINNHFMTYCKYNISIVVSSWNCAHTLLYTLRSLENTYIVQNFNDKIEVVIVDDGSNDNTEEIIKQEKFSYKIKYIKQIHLGRAQGINMACKNATGDIIIFCDADIIFFPFTIDEIVKRQQEYLGDTIFFGFREDIESVCQLNNINEFIYNKKPNFWLDNRFIPDVPGSFCSNMMLETNMLLKFSCMKNMWVSNNEVSMYDCWQLYRMVYGFLFSVSKKNFEKIGGFSEFLVGWGCDDTTFVAQAIEKGIKIIPVPSAHTLHIKHPIRMKTQWEDGKKNEIKMNEYLSQKNRINYLESDYEKRIITKFEKKSEFISPTIKKYHIDLNNDIELADYHYLLGNLEKAFILYKNNYKKLNIMQKENYYDILIRLDKKEIFNSLPIDNNCYFYVFGYYYFNQERIDVNINSESKYIKYVYKVYDHLKRANQYYQEKQYYLSAVDYFANYLLNGYKEKLDLCIKKQAYNNKDS